MTNKNKIFRRTLMEICGLYGVIPDDGNDRIIFYCQFLISNEAFERMPLRELKAMIIVQMRKLRLDINDRIIDSIRKIEEYDEN